MTIPADRISIDLCLLRKASADDGKVTAPDFFVFHHMIQQRLQQRIFAEKQDAAGFHIKTMQRMDGNLLLCLIEIMTDTVAQGMVCIIAVTVYQHACFFIDDQQQFILIENLYRMIPGGNLLVIFKRDDGKEIAAFQYAFLRKRLLIAIDGFLAVTEIACFA